MSESKIFFDFEFCTENGKKNGKFWLKNGIPVFLAPKSVSSKITLGNLYFFLIKQTDFSFYIYHLLVNLFNPFTKSATELLMTDWNSSMKASVFWLSNQSTVSASAGAFPPNKFTNFMFSSETEKLISGMSSMITFPSLTGTSTCESN